MAGTYTAILCHEAEAPFEGRRNKIKGVQGTDDCEAHPPSPMAYLDLNVYH